MAFNDIARDMWAKYEQDWLNQLDEDSLSRVNAFVSSDGKTSAEYKQDMDIYNSYMQTYYNNKYTIAEFNNNQELYVNEPLLRTYRDYYQISLTGVDGLGVGLSNDLQNHSFTFEYNGETITKTLAEVGQLNDGNNRKGLYSMREDALNKGQDTAFYDEQIAIAEALNAHISQQCNYQANVINSLNADTEYRKSVDEFVSAMVYGDEETANRLAEELYAKEAQSIIDKYESDYGANGPSIHSASDYKLYEARTAEYESAKAFLNPESTVENEVPESETPEPETVEIEDNAVPAASSPTSTTTATTEVEDTELSTEDKIAAISEFESQPVRINGVADKKLYDERKAEIDQYKQDVVNGFDDMAKPNGEADAKRYNERRELVDKYKEDLGLTEIKDEDTPKADAPKKDPYAFEKPARESGMSDADYETACATAEAEHIKAVNTKIADEIWIEGKWGNGAERVESLTAAGYDVDAIQDILNDRCAVIEDAQEVQMIEEIEIPKADTPMSADISNENDKVQAYVEDGVVYNEDGQQMGTLYTGFGNPNDMVNYDEPESGSFGPANDYSGGEFGAAGNSEFGSGEADHSVDSEDNYSGKSFEETADDKNYSGEAFERKSLDEQHADAAKDLAAMGTDIANTIERELIVEKDEDDEPVKKSETKPKDKPETEKSDEKADTVEADKPEETKGKTAGEKKKRFESIVTADGLTNAYVDIKTNGYVDKDTASFGDDF